MPNRLLNRQTYRLRFLLDPCYRHNSRRVVVGQVDSTCPEAAVHMGQAVLAGRSNLAVEGP